MVRGRRCEPLADRRRRARRPAQRRRAAGLAAAPGDMTLATAAHADGFVGALPGDVALLTTVVAEAVELHRMPEACGGGREAGRSLRRSSRRRGEAGPCRLRPLRCVRQAPSPGARTKGPEGASGPKEEPTTRERSAILGGSESSEVPPEPERRTRLAMAAGGRRGEVAAGTGVVAGRKVGRRHRSGARRG